MDKILTKELPDFFKGVSNIFEEKKDELCKMDADMGDGDLGLTMSKGFSALPKLIEENMDENNIGSTLMKAGMKMATVVPSTMGTLMSSGIIEVGKELKGKSGILRSDMADFFTAYARGVQNRGKCQVGERTLLDSIYPASIEARKAFERGEDIKKIIEAALIGAKEGVEKTKEMLPKYGKAAVFSAKAKGIPDQGAVAGMYMIEGLLRYFK